MYMKLPLIKPKKDKINGNLKNEVKETSSKIEKQMLGEEEVNLVSIAEPTHLQPDSGSEKKVKLLIIFGSISFVSRTVNPTQKRLAIRST